MARRQKVDEEEHNYWMSYSDMMAALFLVFILIISFTLVQYEHAKNELFAQNEQRERDRQKLEEQNRELKASEKTIEDVIGIKAKIIEKLKERFDKKDIKIKVDNTTGAIELDSSILFDVDKSELKTEGKNKLRTVLPEYIDALFEYENEISEIIIEGHTDNDGVAGRTDYQNYLYNLRLSQDRALSVVKFCLDKKSNIFTLNKIEKLKKMLTANGKSYSNLKYVNGHIDKKASRRVEVKFRLGDDKMIAEINKALGKNKQEK